MFLVKEKLVLCVVPTVVVFLLFFFFFAVQTTHAQGTGVSGGGNGTSQSGGGGTSVSGGAEPGETTELTNPLKAKTITEFLLAIVEVLLVFATPIIVLYIMYAGFLFVTAQGNPGEIEHARSALLWAVVGGVIVLGAKIILEVIEGTIKGFTP